MVHSGRHPSTIEHRTVARSPRIGRGALGGVAALTALCGIAAAGMPIVSDGRAAVDRKGSLLIFPAVEIKWNAQGTLVQDAYLTLLNDFASDVRVQLYFINGDAPLDPVYDQTDKGPVLIERGHPGWNWVDVQISLTGDQPTYWSALTGEPEGVSSFRVLDPGTPPGRPDHDPLNPGGRVLRGYVIGWAVDNFGREIRWNHLSGSAVVVNHVHSAAWEYAPWAFQAHSSIHGQEPPSCLVFNLESGQCVDSRVVPGSMDLDGYEYDNPPGKLLFQFHAAGAAYPNPNPGQSEVPVDTQLVLFPTSADLRQDNDGPITTKAKFDVWNENEIRFSGTERCVTCWDMTYLDHYTVAPIANHFLMDVLQTSTGKARVGGLGSQVCDVGGSLSREAALLGIVQRTLHFSGGVERTAASMVGQGDEVARIQYDIIEPPDEQNE